MVILTVVRHGQTEMNRDQIVQSRTHGDLTPEGVKMAENLGQHLKNEKFTRVYSSDLKRCHDTTLNILKHSNHTTSEQIVLNKILRERDYGDLEFLPCKTVEDILEKSDRSQFGHHNVPIPGGESYTDVMKRCAHFIEEMCKLADTSDDKQENVLVVSHGVWILGFFDYLAANPDAFDLQNYEHEGPVPPRKVLNTARTKLHIGKTNDQNNRKRSIKFFDIVCTAHLDDV